MKFPFRIIESDSIPDDTVIVVPGSRRVTIVTMPDGRQWERGETWQEYAKRCVVIRVAEDQP